MRTVLEIIWDGLETRNVTALLIGGHALSAFGVARQTLDIDCLMVDSDSGAIHTILTEAGYRETERTENFIRYSHSSIYLMDVDVMLVDRGTFDKMLQRSSVDKVGNINVRIPCLVHLIALKLHAIRNNPKRELKDLGDIVELLRSNQGKVPGEELKSTCARYGPDGIYAKLESYL